MAAGWDTSRYLSLFVGEATEHLEALGKDLVRLEQDKAEAPALVDSLFRHAHSVKGMAASMGFEGTATLAHRLEDLLHALRTEPARFDKGTGDLVLAAVDTLAAHVKAASEGQPPADATALAARLAQATAALVQPAAGAAKGPEPAPAPAGPPPPAPAPVADLSLPPRFALKLRVSPAASQPGVRGFLAYKRLSLLGNVFDLKPPLEDVKAGRIPDGVITLELETEEHEPAVRKALKAVADVELEAIKVVAQAARPQPKAEKEAEPRPLGEPARTVRVRTELLDDFLDAAGELLLATARVREVGKALPETLRPPLDEAVDRLHGLVKDLHGKVMKARMTPLSLITDWLPRAARDVARRRGRDVELTVTGADIELDRAIVDELADPLLHLLRNAIDHGVEPPEERRMRGKDPRGKVTVAVRRQRDLVELEVSDDGRGMDGERLKNIAVERGLLTAEAARVLSEREALLLCCLPGVSTAADITDISGRGVGMDAVKRAVELVGGTLDLESVRGKGTTVRLMLPLTVAVVNLLLVGVGEEVFGLPVAKVSGVVQQRRESLAFSHASPVLNFGQTVVPVHELSRVLALPGTEADAQALSPFVVVEGDDGPLALGVDALLGQQEVVLKALARPLDLVPGLAGVTILGNGRPVFILDVARLVTA